MSRRSCSGGRPKSRALPRRSKCQAASTGSPNSQRASNRSLEYGRRVGMLQAYRRGPSAPRRTATTTEAHGREGRASWDETGATYFTPHLPPRLTSKTQPASPAARAPQPDGLRVAGNAGSRIAYFGRTLALRQSILSLRPTLEYHFTGTFILNSFSAFRNAIFSLSSRGKSTPRNQSVCSFMSANG
jgi:hypothetical protein